MKFTTFTLLALAATLAQTSQTPSLDEPPYSAYCTPTVDNCCTTKVKVSYHSPRQVGVQPTYDCGAATAFSSVSSFKKTYWSHKGLWRVDEELQTELRAMHNCCIREETTGCSRHGDDTKGEEVRKVTIRRAGGVIKMLECGDAEVDRIIGAEKRRNVPNAKWGAKNLNTDGPRKA